MFRIVLQGLGERAGTTMVAVSLAYSLSRNQHRTLFIDAHPSCTGAGWILTGEQNKNGWINCSGDILKNAFRCAGCLWYLPSGSASAGIQSASPLRERIQTLYSITGALSLDYIIIDGGQRGSEPAEISAEYADMVITLLEPDPNSLLRLNSTKPADNEYLLINKYDYRSMIMKDIEIFLRSSSFRDRLLSAVIPLDEFVPAAFLSQKPVTAFVPFAASSVEIDKIIVDLLLHGDSTGSEKNHE